MALQFSIRIWCESEDEVNEVFRLFFAAGKLKRMSLCLSTRKELVVERPPPDWEPERARLIREGKKPRECSDELLVAGVRVSSMLSTQL